MALKHHIYLESGIDCPDAYARINRIEHTHTYTYVQVQWWADSSARRDNMQIIREQSYYIPWAETTSIQAAYVALKALPDFTGAIDA